MEKNNFSYAKRKKIFVIPMLILFVMGLLTLISATMPTPPLKAYITYPYDDYADGNINNSLWTNTTVTRPVGGPYQCFTTETAGVSISAYTNSNDKPECTATVTSIAMPPLDYIENISVLVNLHSGSGGYSGYSNAVVDVFGLFGSSLQTGCGDRNCQNNLYANVTVTRNYTNTNYFNYRADIRSCSQGRTGPQPCSTNTYTFYNINGTSTTSSNQIYGSAWLQQTSSGLSASDSAEIQIINYTLNDHIITVNSIYPPDNSIFSNGNIIFNGSAITNNYNTGWNSLVNMSLVIDGVINQTVGVSGKGVTDYSIFTMSEYPFGNQSYVYDSYSDGNINPLLWNYTKSGGGYIANPNNFNVSEISNTGIFFSVNDTGAGGSISLSAYNFTKASINSLNNLNFTYNVNLTNKNIGTSSYSTLTIFGSPIDTETLSGIGTTIDNSNYSIVKNFLTTSLNFDVYKNNVWIMSIPSQGLNDTNITMTISSNGNGPNSAFSNAEIFPIKYSYGRTPGNGVPLGTHKWSIQACDNSNTCTYSTNHTVSVSYLTVVNQSYTPTVYETSAQYFQINVQFNTALYPNAYANLVYDGVTYTSNKFVVGNDVKYSTYIDIPAITTTIQKTFNWHLYSTPAVLQDSTDTNQTVNPIAFSICGGTGGSNAFVNMVYLDENTLAPVNLSVLSSTFNYWIGNGTTYKSYFYSSGTNASFNNSFCFTPASIPTNLLFSNINYQYGINGVYPPRTFQTAAMIPPYLTLTNSSVNQNLYTLSVLESSPITFQVIDQSSASVVPGATVTITRNVAGNNVQVFSGLTDGAGTVNVWLSTTSTYTVTASKTGCGIFTSSIIPVSSYNIQLNCAGNLTKFNSYIDGVTYVRTPANGITTSYGTVQYEYRVISILTPMTAAKFSLVDQQGNIVATNETLVNSSYTFCTGASCTLTLSYNSVCGDNIKGRYYINMGNVSNYTYILLEADAMWRFVCINQTNSQNSFANFFDRFNTFFFQWSAGGQSGVACNVYTNSATCSATSYCKWVDYQGYAGNDYNLSITGTGGTHLCILRDDYNKAEFSRIILIFFGIVIVLFIMGKTTGYEMTNPGSFLMFMTGGIVILSYGGMFRFVGATPWPFFDQWIYAFICLGFSVGYNIAIVRRYSA